MFAFLLDFIWSTFKRGSSACVFDFWPSRSFQSKKKRRRRRRRGETRRVRVKTWDKRIKTDHSPDHFRRRLSFRFYRLFALNFFLFKVSFVQLGQVWNFQFGCKVWEKAIFRMRKNRQINFEPIFFTKSDFLCFPQWGPALPVQWWPRVFPKIHTCACCFWKRAVARTSFPIFQSHINNCSAHRWTGNTWPNRRRRLASEWIKGWVILGNFLSKNQFKSLSCPINIRGRCSCLSLCPPSHTSTGPVDRFGLRNQDYFVHMGGKPLESSWRKITRKKFA